jgi:hypothetical protein
MSGIVLFGAGGVAPAPSLSAQRPLDGPSSLPTIEAPDPAVQSSEPVGPTPVAVGAEPVEVPEMRTVDSKTVRNPDGTYTTEYFADAVHFQDETGAWQPIEAVPVESDEPGKAFETKRGPVMVRFSDSSVLGDLVTVTGGEDSVRYRASLPVSLDGFTLPNDVAPVSDGTHVSYPGLYDGVDVRYTLLAGGVKEDIVLTAPGAPNRFAFVLDAPGLRADLQDDGSVTLSRGGEVRFRIPAPFMVDSADEPDGDGARSNAVSYQLIEVARIKVLIIEADQGWLDDPARVYPVYVDPSTTNEPYNATLDTFISSAYPSTSLDDQWNPNEGGYYELWNGRYDATSGTNYAFVKTGIPSGKTIVSAKFRIYVQHSYSLGTATTIQLGRLTSAFSESQTWNMTHPTYVALGSDSVADNQWAEWTVTSTVESWVYGSATNHGFRIYESSTDQSLWKRLRARENGTNKPTLLVTWAVPLATSVSPSGGAWTNSTLLDWNYSSEGSGDPQTKFQAQISTSSTTWSGGSLKVDSGQVSSSATSWTAPTANLTNGTTYYWRVRVFDGHTWSAYSTVQSFKRDAASPTFTSATVGGAITAADPDYYDLGNGTFTVKIRGADSHSGIQRTILRLTGGSDALTAYHDWSGSSTNCTVSDPSTVVNVTACSRTYNSGGTREVQFTVVGLGQDLTSNVNYALTDVAGSRLPSSSYTDTGKNLIFDAAAPTAAITSPAAGNTVSGSVPILGTASDANFKEYQLHYESADAPGVWNPIGPNPYTTTVTNGSLGTWNAAELADGSYTLRLQVFDKARVNSGFTELLRPVTVANGSALDAEITSPPEGSVVEDMVSIIGTAAATQSFDRYELHYGAGCDPSSWADIGVNPRTTPVTDGALGDWDTTGLAGDHTIRMTVYQVGEMSAQASICVHVGPRLPEVSLTSPAESAVLFSTEGLTATATHESGIAIVEFLVDGAVIGTDTTEPFSVSFDTSLVLDGPRVVAARATAITDEVATSASVTVDVSNGLAVNERVEADYEAGHLTVDEYVLAGVYAHGSPGELDARYSAGADVVGDMASATEYASKWDDLTQATQDEVSAFLAQPMRGWLYGAVEETGGGSFGPVSLINEPNVSDQCVLKIKGGHLGWDCSHLTEHFEIHYTLDGTGGDAARDSISELPDDVGTDALSDAVTGCPSWWAPGKCNGVPDQVDQIAQCLEGAYDVYTDPNGMGFSGAWSGRTVVIVRGGLDGGKVWPNALTCLSLLEDTETIEIEKNSGAPYYLAHHELFHIFQHDHIACGSWGTSALLGVGPWWWAEATAEWATGQVSRSGNFGNTGQYANSIARFFATPDARLDTLERPDLSPPPHRQYGAFVFAEHLAEHVGTGGALPPYNLTVVRETWEEIGTLATPQRPVDAIDAVLGEHGTSLAAVVSEFSLANYLLEYTASDLEPEWRFRLENDDPLTASDGLGPARPARDRYDISDGQRIEGTRTVPFGGASYIELAPPLTEGTLLVDVSGASEAELHARLVALDYRAPPQAPFICDDQVISLDGTGGVAAVDVDGGCRYAVLILTGLLDGVPNPVDWGAQFIEASTQSSCVDSFSRTVGSGSWGTSEFGTPWASWQAGGPDDPQASVNGTAAVISGENSSYLAAEGLSLDVPTEVLVRWRFTGSGASLDNYFQVGLHHVDSADNVSVAYERDFVGGTDFSRTWANHDGAGSSGTAPVAAPDGQWMWLKLGLFATQTRMKVWQDGQAEPGIWDRIANGSALPNAPDAVTIFANAAISAQGVEVDSISVVDGCQYMSWTDPFDRTVQAHTGAGAGWGEGPMGSWEVVQGSTAGSWAVQSGIASHTSAEGSLAYVGLDVGQLLGAVPRSELDLLVKWRVDTVPTDNQWSFEAYLTDAAGLSSEYAGVGLAGFSTDEAFINAGYTYASLSDFYNAAPGYPRPMHAKDMWLRLLVDEFGVYARVWADGEPEPVHTGGIVPPYGGRSERWNTYQVNDSGLPPMAWQYITLRMSGGADVTSVDSVRLTAP